MLNFQTGIFDRVRIFSNVLMLILLAGNLFFSIQYIENLKQQAEAQAKIEQSVSKKIKIARFTKYFIDTVLSTKGTISFDDRVKLEADVRDIQDADILSAWIAFVGSKDNAAAQDNAVKLMSLLVNKQL